MRLRTKLLLSAALALIALTATVTNATAASLVIRPAGDITMASLGQVTLRGAVFAPSCLITLTGSLHTGTIEKVTGALIGFINAMRTSECRGVSVPPSILNLPWHLTYDSILGTLPSAVAGLLFAINGFSFLWNISGITCLWRGNPNALLAVTGRNPYTSGLITLGLNAIPLSTEPLNSGLCPEALIPSGTFGLTPQQTITRI